MEENYNCPRCAAPKSRWVRDGFYHRHDDSKNIQRWKCKDCSKKFSAATFKATYNQKKRQINQTIRFGLDNNMRQREIAALVSVNVKTIAARSVWLGKLA